MKYTIHATGGQAKPNGSNFPADGAVYAYNLFRKTKDQRLFGNAQITASDDNGAITEQELASRAVAEGWKSGA